MKEETPPKDNTSNCPNLCNKLNKIINMIHFQIRNFVFIFLLCDAASAVFQPADRAALKSAVDACLQSDDTGITILFLTKT